MDLNVKSIFFLTQELAPLLRVKGTIDDPSRIINIGSIDGMNVAAFETYSYGASKAAVHNLTRQLAKRQITWLRSWDKFMQIKPNQSNDIDNAFKKILSTL